MGWRYLNFTWGLLHPGDRSRHPQKLSFGAENDQVRIFFGGESFADRRVRISNFPPPPPCHGLGYEGGRSEPTIGAFAPGGTLVDGLATLQVEFEAEKDEVQVLSFRHEFFPGLESADFELSHTYTSPCHGLG